MIAEAAPKTRTETAAIFGSFHLGETELVMGIESLQEVVAFPERITKMPLAPDHLLGFFNLRGEVIPVVNLKRILGSDDCEPAPTQKVAIVECGGARVGLLFDATGEVLRVREEARCDFRYGSETVHPVFSGALKLDGGSRILQVLDASALLKVENIPQIVEWQNREGGAARRRGRARIHAKKCISFRCGGARLGFDMAGIFEIIRVPPIQKSILKSEVCLGTIALRERVIPVVDFSRFMGGTPAAQEASDERRIIVMRREEVLFGLLVDAVENIASYAAEEVIPIPLMAQGRSKMFQGCIPEAAGREIILLDHREIFSNADILELTQGHSRLYEAGARTAEKAKTSQGREVFISFTLGHLFGLPIGQVNEILDFPREILRAPGLPAFVPGLINLRGQIVTLVDTRVLYGMPASEAAREKMKVLILKREGGEKVGFIVDTLESIVAVDADDKAQLSSLLMQKIEGAVRSDIQEVVETKGEDRKMLLVLNSVELLRRVEAGK